MMTKNALKTTLLAAAGVAALVSLAPTSASAFGGGHFGGGHFGGGHFGGGWGRGPIFGHGPVLPGRLRDPGFNRGGYHWGGGWGGHRWGGYRWGFYPYGGYRFGYGYPVNYSYCPYNTIRNLYGVCVPRFRQF